MSESEEPRGRGQPTKLDDVTLAKLLAALELGHTKSAACGAARITLRTLEHWMAWDREGHPTFAGVNDKIDEAMLVGERALVELTIHLARESGDWRGPMTLLERTRPSTYAHADMIARRDKLRAETEAIKRATSNDGTAGEMLVVELPAEIEEPKP